MYWIAPFAGGQSVEAAAQGAEAVLASALGADPSGGLTSNLLRRLPTLYAGAILGGLIFRGLSSQQSSAALPRIGAGAAVGPRKKVH